MHLGYVYEIPGFEVAPKLRGVGRFALQVELAVDDAIVFCNHFFRLQATAAARPTGQQPGHVPQQSKILIDRFLYARPQYLHHHITAIGQSRAVHLRHRSGGQRVGIKFGKAFIQRFTQGVLDPLNRLFCREGRYLILKQRQLICDVVGEQVAPGRE